MRLESMASVLPDGVSLNVALAQEEIVQWVKVISHATLDSHVREHAANVRVGGTQGAQRMPVFEAALVAVCTHFVTQGCPPLTE